MRRWRCCCAGGSDWSKTWLRTCSGSKSIAEKNIPPLFLVEAEYRLALMKAEQHFVAELIRRIESGWGPLDLWRDFHENRETTIAKLYRQFGGAPMN